MLYKENNKFFILRKLMLQINIYAAYRYVNLLLFKSISVYISTNRYYRSQYKELMATVNNTPLACTSRTEKYQKN